MCVDSKIWAIVRLCFLGFFLRVTNITDPIKPSSAKDPLFEDAKTNGEQPRVEFNS